MIRIRARPVLRPDTAMVVLGMQNDLMHPDGALFNPDLDAFARKHAVVANLRRLASEVRHAGGRVIHVLQVVEAGCRGQQLNAPVFDVLNRTGAVVRGGWGARPYDEFPPERGDLVVEKQRMNGFYGSRLDAVLRGLEISHVVCAGAMTNTAVEHTARYAADAGYRVTVPSDATAATDEGWQSAAVEYGLPLVADVVTVQEIIEHTLRKGE